jgi:hypothetical protein
LTICKPSDFKSGVGKHESWFEEVDNPCSFGDQLIEYELLTNQFHGTAGNPHRNELVIMPRENIAG